MNAYLEIGAKKVFAVAVDWPGFARSGKDEHDALDQLLTYGRRYAVAVSLASLGFKPPKELKVVGRVLGDMTTNFGAPGSVPKLDGKTLSSAELKRQVKLLRACWATFDVTAKKYAKSTLAKGPRGGGRSVAKMLEHVMGADRAYLSAIGGTLSKGEDLREAIVVRLDASNRGAPIESKRKKDPWPPRYAVRRSAWHALDHAWEIEDKAH